MQQKHRQTWTAAQIKHGTTWVWESAAQLTKLREE